jgi:hypothetical protein
MEVESKPQISTHEHENSNINMETTKIEQPTSQTTVAAAAAAAPAPQSIATNSQSIPVQVDDTIPCTPIKNEILNSTSTTPISMHSHPSSSSTFNSNPNTNTNTVNAAVPVSLQVPSTDPRTLSLQYCKLGNEAFTAKQYDKAIQQYSLGKTNNIYESTANMWTMKCVPSNIGFHDIF